MTDVLVILCTCPNKQEATKLAAHLVEGRFAACVNIIPSVASVYRWEERVQMAEEVLLLIKTTAAELPALQDAIASAHSYDVPEILAIPVVQGFEKYVQWVRESVGSDRPSNNNLEISLSFGKKPAD